jgi:hypothetical protein
MPLWVDLLIAAVVSFGVIAVVRAIITGLTIARRPPHDTGQQSSTSPKALEAQIPPPPG